MLKSPDRAKNGVIEISIFYFAKNIYTVPGALRLRVLTLRFLRNFRKLTATPFIRESPKMTHFSYKKLSVYKVQKNTKRITYKRTTFIIL